MSSNYTTFPNEKVLLRLANGETLVSVKKGGECSLVAIHQDGFRTDYPTLSANGVLLWYCPESFTKTFRRECLRVLQKMGGKP